MYFALIRPKRYNIPAKGYKALKRLQIAFIQIFFKFAALSSFCAPLAAKIVAPLIAKDARPAALVYIGFWVMVVGGWFTWGKPQTPPRYGNEKSRDKCPAPLGLFIVY